MFKFNIGGTPTLTMLPWELMEADQMYLSSNQMAVVMRTSRDDSHIVYDLHRNTILVYTMDENSDMLDDHPAIAVVFPHETVGVTLSLEIMGAVK